MEKISVTHRKDNVLIFQENIRDTKIEKGKLILMLENDTVLELNLKISPMMEIMIKSILK